MIGDVALMVKLTESLSIGSPSNTADMSSTVSMATPTRPTSAVTSGWFES